jgi:arabinofuranosyltransferase
MQLSGRRQALTLAFILLGFALLALPYLLRGYVVDDTFIHLQFARNLARHHEMSFNHGDPVYGASSPLWVALLALALPLGNPPTVAQVMDILFGLGALAMFFLLVRRLFGHPVLALAATLVLATDPFLLRWSTCGMESSLAALLVFLTLYLYAADRERDGIPVRAPLAAGLSYLLRPDTGFLLGVMVVDQVLFAPRGRRRLVAGVAATIVLFFLVAAPWIAYALAVYGTVIPTTALAKGAHLPMFSRALPTGLRIALTVLLTHGLQVLALAVFLGLSAARGRWAGLWARARRHAPAAMWGVGILAVYCAGGNVVSRYLLTATPLLTAYALKSAHTLAGASGRARDRWMLGFSVLLVAWNAALGVSMFASVRNSGYLEHMTAVGTWLREHTPPNTVVAADEIGIIGYYSERPILDLEGLITPAIIPYKFGPGVSTGAGALLKGDTFEYLRIARPGYIVYQSLRDTTLARTEEGRRHFRPVLGYRHAENQLNSWKPGDLKYVYLYRCVW